MDSHFDDYADAKRSGLFEKGWLPAWLPTSAIRIHERHNIDSSATLIKFEFSPEDRPPFGGSCKTVERDELSLTNLGASWWPNEPDLKSLPRLYKCAADSGFLAVPQDGKTAFFWRIRA